MERIIHLMQTDKMEAAPVDAIRWSKNVFRSRAVESGKSMVEKVLAVLRIDLSPNKAAFGERSATASNARQLLFEAGENSLDLRISESGESRIVRGQVLGEGFAGARVKLGEFETTANELSEFYLANVPKGTYALTVNSDEKEILIEVLELA